MGSWFGEISRSCRLWLSSVLVTIFSPRDGAMQCLHTYSSQNIFPTPFLVCSCTFQAVQFIAEYDMEARVRTASRENEKLHPPPREVHDGIDTSWNHRVFASFGALWYRPLAALPRAAPSAIPLGIVWISLFCAQKWLPLGHRVSSATGHNARQHMHVGMRKCARSSLRAGLGVLAL